MKRNLVFSFVFVTLIVSAMCLSVAGQSRSEMEIFDLVNRERAKARLSGLSWDTKLARLARDYSRQMARQGFFDHFDPKGRSVSDRALDARIRNWSRIGENLFFCDEHPYFTNTAIRGWMRSRTHRINMLDRSWTSTGVGVATAGNGSIFITQIFTRE